MGSSNRRIFWLLFLAIILNTALAIWNAGQGDTLWVLIHCANFMLVMVAMGDFLKKVARERDNE